MLGVDEGGEAWCLRVFPVPATSPCLLRRKSDFHHSPALKPTLAPYYPWAKSKLFNRTHKNLKNLAPAYLSFLLSWTPLLQDPYLVAATKHCCSPGHWMPRCRLASWTPVPANAWGTQPGDHSTASSHQAASQTFEKNLYCGAYFIRVGLISYISGLLEGRSCIDSSLNSHLPHRPRQGRVNLVQDLHTIFWSCVMSPVLRASKAWHEHRKRSRQGLCALLSALLRISSPPKAELTNWEFIKG